VPNFSQSVADLFATLGIDTSKFDQALSHTKSATQKAAEEMRGHFQQIEAATQKLGNTLGPQKVAAALKDAAKEGIALQQVIDALQVKTDKLRIGQQVDANKRAKEIVSQDILGASGTARQGDENDAAAMKQRLVTTQESLRQQAASQKDYSSLVKQLRGEEHEANARVAAQEAEGTKNGIAFYRDRAAQQIQANKQAIASNMDYSNLTKSLRAEELAGEKRVSDARAVIAADARKRQQEMQQQQIGHAEFMARSADEAVKATARAAAAQEAATRQMFSRMTDLGMGLTVIGGMMTVGITAPIVALGKASIDAATKLETQRVIFTKLGGSVESANAHLETLKQFALTTPFEFDEVVDADKRLRAMGFTAKEVLPILMAVGNAAAAMGKGPETVGLITKQLSDIRAKGKVEAQELRVLADNGIAAREILAEAFGITIPEVMERTRKGTISAAEGIKALVEGINKRFGGLMEDQMSTMMGRVSNFKDKITFALQEIGTPLIGVGKRILDFAEIGLAGISNMAKAFGGMPPVLQDIIIAVAGAVAVMGPLLVAAGGLAFSIGQIGLAFPVATAGMIAWAATSAGPVALGFIAIAAAVSLLVGAFSELTEKSRQAQAGFEKWMSSATTEARAPKEIAFRKNQLIEAREKELISKEFYLEQMKKLDATEVEMDRLRLKNSLAGSSLGLTIGGGKKVLTEEGYAIQAEQLRRTQSHAKAMFDIRQAASKAQQDANEISAAREYHNTVLASGQLLEFQKGEIKELIAQEKAKGDALADERLKTQLQAAGDAHTGRVSKADILYETTQRKREEERVKLAVEMEKSLVTMTGALQDDAFKQQTKRWADELAATIKHYDQKQDDAEKAQTKAFELDLQHQERSAKLQMMYNDLYLAEGKITAKEKLAMDEEVYRAEYEHARQAINDQIAQLSLRKENNKAAIEALQGKLTAMEDAHAMKTLADEIRNAKKEMSEYQRAADRAFNNVARGIARNIVEFKGFGATVKEVAKDMAQGMLEVLIQDMLKPVKKAMIDLVKAIEDELFKPLLKKLKDVLIDIFGSGAGKAGGAGGAAGGGIIDVFNLPTSTSRGGPNDPYGIGSIPTWNGSPVPGGGGGAAPVGGGGGMLSGVGGIAGATNLVSGIVSAVSGVVGNFQMYGMNKSLDLLVNHTLRMFNEIFQQRIDHWSQFNQTFTRLGEIWNELKGGGKGGTVNHITITGVTNLDSMIRELKAKGFVIAPM